MKTAPIAPTQARDLQGLIDRSRRIGARADLVVHGGGNTSTKTAGPDHLGRVRPMVLVKASGADLATLGASGISRLFLDDLLVLRDRAGMDDTEMSAFLAHCLVDLISPRPSIETLLHAFIPAQHVDHVHADAICALTKAPDPRATVREALGREVAFIDWIRPGFALAKLAAEFAGADAIVLAHHGLVTWSDDPEGSFERTLAIVDRAERYLRGRGSSRNAAARANGMLEADERELLLRLRGRLSREARRVLYVDRAGREISDRQDLKQIVDAGPATADHLMYVRPRSLVIRSASEAEHGVTMAEARYATYFDQHRDRVPPGTAMNDPRPTVMIVPGLGRVTTGRDAGEARLVADIAAHTHSVAAQAIDAFGEVRSLPEEALFDVDYWPLELAKRAGQKQGPEFEGRIYVITGAGGGIGRAVAVALTRLSASLVLTDVDPESLDRTRDEVAAAGHDPTLVVADIADDGTAERLIRAAIGAYGGVDGVVSNAGIAVTGQLREVERIDWDRSMAVNATSHFLVAREALRAFETQGLGGSIVFVASKNAFSPGAGFGPYSAAKAAEIQIARMTALEGGPIGVRSNVINPDAVFQGSALWSPELRAARAAAHGVPPERLEEFYAGRNLLHVAVRPRDVAEAAVFLLSDRSSRTTGCVITVDGGVESAFPR